MHTQVWRREEMEVGHGQVVCRFLLVFARDHDAAQRSAKQMAVAQQSHAIRFVGSAAPGRAFQNTRHRNNPPKKEGLASFYIPMSGLPSKR